VHTHAAEEIRRVGPSRGKEPMLGTFAAGGTTVDLFILIGIGMLGLLMRGADIPVAPAIVGLILGPLAEQQLRRALTLSEGDPSILLSSPITYVLWAVVVLALIGAFAMPLLRRRREAQLLTTPE
jgi:putative tricarboxylic transport membrane protein